MDFRLLSVYILFCFRVIRCKTESKEENNVQSSNIVSNLTDHSEGLQNPSIKEFIQSSPKVDQCVDSLRAVFQHETCKSSKNEDDLRCQLIKAVTDDVCQISSHSDVQSYYHAVVGLCEKHPEPKSIRTPSTIVLFFQSWNLDNSHTLNCKNVCLKSDGSYYLVCEFIFNYYASKLFFVNYGIMFLEMIIHDDEFFE